MTEKKTAEEIREILTRLVLSDDLSTTWKIKCHKSTTKIMKIMEAYAAQQSEMPTDTESEKASRDFALRIFDDRTQKVRIADTMWGWQKCFEWLRNQIER